MRSRLLPAALLCAGLLTLAACSDTPAEPSATPAAGTSAGTSAAAGAPVAIGDAELCRTVDTAGKAMKTGITESQQSQGGVLPADAKRHFTKFHTTVGEALTSASASPVTTAAQALSDEIGVAADSGDPVGTAAGADFEGLSRTMTTVCAAAGVEIDF